MNTGIRGDLIQPLGEQFGLTKEQIGLVASTAFWGFTLAMIFGGPLCDVVGMGRLLILAFIGHAVGIVMTILAHDFWTLFFSTLIFGLANGFVEAACNPLIATLYPDQKIKRLNMFHVWFPGGIVIGGLTAFAITQVSKGASWESHSWQVKMATMLIPLAVYAVMFLGKKFPATERVASGVSMGAMFKECLRPFFILFVICMLMTAVTELGPQQWFPNILTLTTGIQGILFLVWITGLMAVGRMFAGPIVHRISPVAMLIASSLFAAIGLYMISVATAAPMAFIAATLFAIGVCFFWPTMLGTVSERFPKTGSLGLAIMGGAGTLASGYIQPIIGKTYDDVTAKTAIVRMADPSITSAISLLAAAPAPADAKPDDAKKSTALKETYAKSQGSGKDAEEAKAGLLKAAAEAPNAPDTLKTEWTKAQAAGGSAALKQVVVLPIILLVVFSGIFLFDRARGGYQKEVLVQNQDEDADEAAVTAPTSNQT